MRARRYARGMRRWIVSGVVGGVGALVWIVSCVGDSSNIPAGQDGGVCLSNGTCDDGLVCTIQGSSTKCLPPGSSNDGATNDAKGDGGPPGDGTTSDSPVDAPLSCDADANGALNFFNYCTTPSTTNAACLSTLDASITCLTVGNCGPNEFAVSCLENTDTFHCCLTGAQAVNACTPTLDLAHDAETILSSSKFCSGLFLCDGGAQCIALDASTCVPTAVTGVPSLATSIIGVCH
jgi:hypothetical protein